MTDYTPFIIGMVVFEWSSLLLSCMCSLSQQTCPH